jgi:hypothetical protein
MSVFLQKNFFLTSKEDSVICEIVEMWILSHLWWGKLHIMLGVHNSLMRNGVL